MPSTFATLTDFVCNDSGCKRIATQFHSSYRTAPQNGRSMLERLKRGIVCNIHAGGIKRRWQGRYNSRNDETLVPLAGIGSEWDNAKADYFAEREAANYAAIARNNEAREQNRLESEARFAKAWVERSLEVEPDVTHGTERRSYDDHYRDGFTVGDRKDSWGNIEVIASQDGKHPAVVEITSMRRMSPLQARAVAKALLMAADLADIRDTTNGPIVKE